MLASTTAYADMKKLYQISRSAAKGSCKDDNKESGESVSARIVEERMSSFIDRDLSQSIWNEESREAESAERSNSD